MLVKFNDVDETIMQRNDVIGYSMTWTKPGTILVETPIGICIHLEHKDKKSMMHDLELLDMVLEGIVV